MNLHYKSLKIMILIILVSAFAVPVQSADFSGKWNTTFGPMDLKQTDSNISGYYISSELPCHIEGKLVKDKFSFTYYESGTKGEGWFILAEDGRSFSGKWKEEKSTSWSSWEGTRKSENDTSEMNFSGLWNTTWGRMKIKEEKSATSAIYNNSGVIGQITGKTENERFTFKYTEGKTSGKGWFELSDDKECFYGKWKTENMKEWKDWTGVRIHPRPGQYWLVVLEARWEKNLADKEYSFGRMLREFFARAPQVNVRHRFFNDKESLANWCREIPFLAEPVVLSIASHGLENGLEVGTDIIGSKEIADCLKYCDNIKLLHFSACLMMKDELPEELMKALGTKAVYPISGYTTSVDWGMSVLVEFLYFDLILTRNYEPAAAAKEVLHLLPFSGDKKIPDAPFESAGFKFVTPKKK